METRHVIDRESTTFQYGHREYRDGPEDAWKPALRGEFVRALHGTQEPLDDALDWLNGHLAMERASRHFHYVSPLVDMCRPGIFYPAIDAHARLAEAKAALAAAPAKAAAPLQAAVNLWSNTIAEL